MPLIRAPTQRVAFGIDDAGRVAARGDAAGAHVRHARWSGAALSVGVAKLAPPVVAPAVHAAITQPRAGMATAGRDFEHVSQADDLGGRPPVPTTNGGIREQRAGVLVTKCQLRDLVQPCNDGRCARLQVTPRDPLRTPAVH